MSLTPENWKAVTGFEGLYEVSDFGRVRSLWNSAANANHPRRVPKLLKQGTGKYRQVVLVRDRVKHPVSVHILVLTEFVGPRPIGMEGAHDDGQTSNNRADNLSWKTHAANVADKKRHGTHQAGERVGTAKLTVNQVLFARAVYVPRSRTVGGKALARKFKVSPTAIQRVVNYQGWIGAALNQGEAR